MTITKTIWKSNEFSLTKQHQFYVYVFDVILYANSQNRIYCYMQIMIVVVCVVRASSLYLSIAPGASQLKFQYRQNCIIMIVSGVCFGTSEGISTLYIVQSK